MQHAPNASLPILQFNPNGWHTIDWFQITNPPSGIYNVTLMHLTFPEKTLSVNMLWARNIANTTPSKTYSLTFVGSADNSPSAGQGTFQVSKSFGTNGSAVVAMRIVCPSNTPANTFDFTSTAESSPGGLVDIVFYITCLHQIRMNNEPAPPS